MFVPLDDEGTVMKKRIERRKTQKTNKKRKFIAVIINTTFIIRNHSIF